MGARRSSYSETDWHQQTEDEFAKQAAETLELTAAKHADADIVIAAAPRTLGELRKHYGPGTTAGLFSEIDKDLTNTDLASIARLVEGYGEG